MCLCGDAGLWTMRCVGCGGAALDEEATWRVCKAAGITLAGVSYLIPNMLVMVISGNLSRLFGTVFIFMCLVSVL